MFRLPSLEHLLLLLPALMFAFTIHELSHGLMAHILGDPTAKRDGRLSLNPIRHIDPIGLICIVLIGFGWAKPVIINPHNLNNPKVDMALISIAGPISNFIMAFLGLMALYPLLVFGHHGYITDVLQMFCWLNIILGVFNLIPIPPLDGSKVIAGVLPDSIYNNLPNAGRFGMLILMIFIFTGITGQILVPLARAINELLFTFVVGFYGWLPLWQPLFD